MIASERVVPDADMLRFHATLPVGGNIRRCGEDVMGGDILLPPAVPLTPDRLAALLACGVTAMEGRRPPVLRLITTGSELVAVGHFARVPRIDSNGPMIAALCRSIGLRCDRTAPVADDTSVIRAALLDGSHCDLVMTTGGVSVGRHDLVAEVLQAIGAKIIFRGIAMRPGKPLVFAILPNGRPFFGLPGNSVAALVGFRFFAMAAVRAMLGLPSEQGVPLEAPFESREGTTLFLRAQRHRDNRAIATPLADQRSHVMSSVVEADCWIRVDADKNGRSAQIYEKFPQLEGAR